LAPVAATRALRETVRFCIGAVPLQVEIVDPGRAGPLADWLARAFLTTDAHSTAESPLRFRVVAEEVGAAPRGGVQSSAAVAPTPVSPTEVRRDGARVSLRCEWAHCALDLAAGRTELRLAAGWWSQPLKTQQTPWLLSLAWLLRERGCYTLHASAVARGGAGLLIAGDSGSGKSSTALSLIHQGWDFLADDAVLLEPGVAPRLHALARGFAFHPALAERLPGLTGEAVGQKHFAADGTGFPGRPLAACRPAALLFPRVVDADHSRLEPLSPAAALIALLPASTGILCGGGPGQSQAHLSALGDLVARTSAWRLAAGRDIFGRGAVLAALLAAAGVPGA
jgi:hypothetical protein